MDKESLFGEVAGTFTEIAGCRTRSRITPNKGENREMDYNQHDIESFVSKLRLEGGILHVGTARMAQCNHWQLWVEFGIERSNLKFLQKSVEKENWAY